MSSFVRISLKTKTGLSKRQAMVRFETFRNESNEDRWGKEENLTSTTDRNGRSSLTAFPPSCVGLRAETPCCLRFLWDPSVGSPSRGSPPIPPSWTLGGGKRRPSPPRFHQRFRERGRSPLMNETRVINRPFFHPLFRRPRSNLAPHIRTELLYRPRALTTIYPTSSSSLLLLPPVFQMKFLLRKRGNTGICIAVSSPPVRH